MEAERKKAIEIFLSNDGFECEETTEDMPAEEILKLIGFLELVKTRILLRFPAVD